MPLPNDYKILKIHPSIGVARVSTNDEHFVYGEFPDRFKSGETIKRQSLRFRIFAYGINNEGREELTPERLTQLGIRARWRAQVANRKTVRARNDEQYAIEAEAASDADNGLLIGSLRHFQNADRVELGQITPTGLFIPPKAQIFRVSPDAPPHTGSAIFTDPDVSDNSCDGIVTVELFDEANGTQIDIPILGSWILVTPPDFAPDTDDDEVTVFGHERTTLEMWLNDRLLLPDLPLTNPLNQTARELDRDIRRRCTGDFAPGIEASMSRFESNIAELRARIYSQLETKNPEEVRFKPKSGNSAGTIPGELTAGLCSPWQLDFAICTCSFWAAQRPDTAFRDTTTDVELGWLRKKVADINGGVFGELETTEDFIEHVYKLGVLREQNGRVIETERDNDIP